MEEERQGNSGGGSRPSGLCPGNKCPRLRVLVMAHQGKCKWEEASAHLEKLGELFEGLPSLQSPLLLLPSTAAFT